MYKTLIYKKEKSLKMVYFLFEWYFKVFKNCLNKKDIFLECWLILSYLNALYLINSRIILHLDVSPFCIPKCETFSRKVNLCLSTV